MTTSTYRALSDRFADFNLRLTHYPDEGDYQYQLEALHGREAPRVDRFINLPAVESYLRYEEGQHGVPQVAIPADDGLVTINIAGVDIVVPRGTSVEDALQAYEDRDNIGTAEIEMGDVAYVLMLDRELGKLGLHLNVTDDMPEHPFELIRLPHIPCRISGQEFPQYHSTTRMIHKFIKLHSGATPHEASNPGITV